MKRQLIQKMDTTTARGMLSKGWYEENGKLLLVKGNSDFSGVVGYEPYSEVIVSKIAEALGFNAVEYWIAPAADYPEVQVYGVKHVSVCENFIKPADRLVSLYDFIMGKKLEGVTDWYGSIQAYFDLKPVDEILTLDALCGNEDRHMSNIEVIIHQDQSYEIAPVFDNGAALLAWHAESELKDNNIGYKFDSSKPFREKHKSQIKLVDPFLKPFDTEKFYQRICESSEKVIQLLPPKRAEAVKRYLHKRLLYLKKVMR